MAKGGTTTSALKDVVVHELDISTVEKELKEIEAIYGSKVQEMYKARDERKREAEKNLKGLRIR